MAEPCVLCLGELLFDCFANELEQPLEKVNSWTFSPGGAPANVACSLIQLGTTAGFIGSVGQDESGQKLQTFLRERDVNIEGIQIHPTASTRHIYVLRTETGERSFVSCGREGSPLSSLDFADIRLQATLLPESLFLTAEWLVLGTVGLAHPDSYEAIQQALAWADQYYLKIFLDINWRSLFWQDPDRAKSLILDLCQKVDFVKCSESEAQWLFSTPFPRIISEQIDGLEGVLVTLGERGCYYCVSGLEGQIPGFSVNVQDTTGAGDGFVGGFIHQVAQSGLKSLQDPDHLRRVITYANAVGALTTTKLGAMTALPTAKEVDAFLASISP